MKYIGSKAKLAVIIPRCLTRCIRRPARNITTYATTRAIMRRGIVRRCFYSPRIIPVFTAVVTARRRKQKTAKRVTISRKVNKTFNVNYPRSEISLSVMPIIAIYVSRRGSGF